MYISSTLPTRKDGSLSAVISSGSDIRSAQLPLRRMSEGPPPGRHTFRHPTPPSYCLHWTPWEDPHASRYNPGAARIYSRVKSRDMLDRIRRTPLPLVAVAIVAMVMAIALTSLNGPGLSTDAVNYLSTADNVARGIGFRNFEGDLYVLWPPLYPAILAGIELLFGVGPQVSASLLNALAFGVIVLALSFLILFDRYARDGDRASYVGLIAVCGLACLQRYIGATLILVGSVGIVYARWSRPRQGMGEAAVFAGLSVAPLGVWIVRNYLVSGTFLGVRDPETWKPMENLLDIGFKAARWFVPYSLSSRPAFWSVLAIGLAVLVLVRRKRLVRPLAGVGPEPMTFVLILFPIIYLAAMVVL